MITKRLDSSDNDYHSLPAYGTPLMVAVKQDNNKVLSKLVKKLNLDDVRKLLRDILRRRDQYQLNTYHTVVKKDYEYNPQFIYKLLDRLPMEEASEIIDKMKLENREVGRFPEIEKMVQQRDAFNTRLLSRTLHKLPEDPQHVITSFLKPKGGKRKLKTNKRKSRRNNRKTHCKRK
jgi:16S rRNA C967 or C1407 C5-methylase (RsmB/RsmF family)